MPRIARIVLPGVPHHIIQRGNRRQQTFFSDDDYKKYMSILAKQCREWELEVWAYCLMPNHVHLIVVPNREESLSGAMREAHRRYSLLINSRNDWNGYLWQGRFSSFPMDEAHLYMAVRYVEQNPVEAGIVEKSWDYEWSSAKAHMTGKDDRLVTVKPLLERFGDWESYLSQRLITRELDLIEKHERSEKPIGSREFVLNIEELTGLKLIPGKRGPKGPRNKDKKD